MASDFQGDHASADAPGCDACGKLGIFALYCGRLGRKTTFRAAR
jgi:hypothetical protein